MGEESPDAILIECGWEALSVGGSDRWCSWYAGSGGVDGLESLLNSRIGGLVID